MGNFVKEFPPEIVLDCFVKMERYDYDDLFDSRDVVGYICVDKFSRLEYPAEAYEIAGSYYVIVNRSVEKAWGFESRTKSFPVMAAYQQQFLDKGYENDFADLEVDGVVSLAVFDIKLKIDGEWYWV